jgi:3-oxoacyl-[acyl-carrier-protein] synthase-3
MPATAAFVQKKIGAGKCPALDISAACAGFIFGLGIGEALLQRAGYQKILVVGVELLSRVLDWTDRNTCVLFGDAAGAAVLVPSDDDRGLLDVELHTDGAYARDLFIPGGGSSRPTGSDTVDEKLHFVHMNGRQIFTQAVRNMSSASMNVLERARLRPDDVTTVFAHQANMRIIEGVSARTKIPLERFFINIQRYGNTSSASVPIAISEALEEGRVKEGDLLLLTALGAGVSWASALVRW